MRFDLDSDGVKGRLSGNFTEESDFDAVLQAIKAPAVTLDLGGVARINSNGVRLWVNFVKALSAARSVTLERCSPTFVNQLNMIANFAGQAKVASILVPMRCTDCDAEAEALARVDEGPGAKTPEGGPCAACGGRTEPDILVEQYFQFLA